MALVVVGSTSLSSLVLLHVGSDIIGDAPVSFSVSCRLVVGVSPSSVCVRVLVVAVIAVVVVAVVVVAVVTVAVVVVAVVFVVVVVSIFVLSVFVLSVLAVAESSRSMILSGGL